MKKQKVNEKGITLIALIVTVIVLMILAGISISVIIGDNGLLSKSKEAREETEKMQNSTAGDRDKLYGELIGNKDQYAEEGTVEVEVDLELEKQTETSFIATVNSTDTKTEIISYTFYIRKVTENDSAYVIIKKSDKLTNTVICSDLEKIWRIE